MSQIEQHLEVKVEDGREAPWKPTRCPTGCPTRCPSSY